MSELLVPAPRRPGVHAPGSDRDAPAGERPTSEAPGYRDSLANERTFLAWIRTALSLVAGAVAVIRLVPPFPHLDLRWLIGALLAAAAAATAATGYRRWDQTEAAMAAGTARPGWRASTATMAVMTAVLSVGVLALAVLSAV